MAREGEEAGEMGAIVGMVAGLATVRLFTPLPKLLFGEGLGVPITDGAAYSRKLFRHWLHRIRAERCCLRRGERVRAEAGS